MSFPDASSPMFLLAGMKNADGTPLSNGLVYVYAAGTTKAKTIYTDDAMTIAASQPVVLDAAGTALLYGIGWYKFVITNSARGIIETIDGVSLGADKAEQYEEVPIQFLASGVVDAKGELLKTGKVYHYIPGGTITKPIWLQPQPIDLADTNTYTVGTVYAIAHGEYKFVITDSEDNVIRTIEKVFIGGYSYGDIVYETMKGRSQQIDCLISGVRSDNGDLLAFGSVFWSRSYLEEIGGYVGTDLCADAALTIPLPEEIKLDSRGTAHVWGRGVYDLGFADKDGNGVGWLDHVQLGFEKEPEI